MGVAQHRARLALVCAVAMLGAACAAPADEPEPRHQQRRLRRRARGRAPTIGAAVGDLRRARGRPAGCRSTGASYGDDMLLVSTETIPDEVVDADHGIKIAGQKAVTAAEPLSIGQFSAREQELPDRGRRRRRLPAVHAGRAAPRSRTQWERVAAGEIARRPRTCDGRLPLDKDGYLAVGSGEQTFPIHVGAYVPQVGTIDAVVNTEWGEELGLAEDNALVIYTGGISPQALRQEAEEDRSATSR